MFKSLARRRRATINEFRRLDGRRRRRHFEAAQLDRVFARLDERQTMQKSKASALKQIAGGRKLGVGARFSLSVAAANASERRACCLRTGCSREAAGRQAQSTATRASTSRANVGGGAGENWRSRGKRAEN